MLAIIEPSKSVLVAALSPLFNFRILFGVGLCCVDESGITLLLFIDFSSSIGGGGGGGGICGISSFGSGGKISNGGGVGCCSSGTLGVSLVDSIGIAIACAGDDTGDGEAGV